MTQRSSYFLFILEDKYFAFPLSSVERVLRAVKLTIIPEGPTSLQGVINMHGKIIPVVDIRKKLGLPDREMGLHDRIILTLSSIGPVAFVVDNVMDVAEFSEDQVDEAEEIFPEMEQYLLGIARLNTKTVLIYDVDILLSQLDISTIDEVGEVSIGEQD